MNIENIQKELELKLEKVLNTTMINGREMRMNFREPKVLIDQRFNMDSMVCQLYDYIWKEELEDIVKEECYEIPSNWFQHLKKDLFPKWALKRWPVKYTGKTLTVRAQVKAYYPTFQQLRGHKAVIKMHELPDFKDYYD